MNLVTLPGTVNVVLSEDLKRYATGILTHQINSEGLQSS